MPRSEAAPRARPAFSIAGRLTLLFALFATGLATLVALIAYRSMTAILENEDRAAQAAALGTLAPLADGAAGDPSRLAVLRARFAGAPAGWGFRLLCAEESRAETTGFAMPPAGEFPAAGDVPGIAFERRLGGRTLHLGALRLSDGCAIHTAFDATREESRFRRLRAGLAGLTALCGLLAALGGGLIARAGLRPLARISERARAITAEKIAQPLGDARLPVELRELAGEFDGMLARLAEAFARLEGYAGDLAHELRTPLANLSLSAELALGDGGEARQREALESLLEEARRLRALVDRLLLIARADRPDAAAVRRPFDLSRLLDRLAGLHAAAAAERGVEIRRAWPAGLTLSGDETLVRQALDDLLDNAVRHAREGGEIRLAAAASGGALILTVEDDGPGIPPEALPRLFERYFRAGAQRPGGLGLGLALVRGVMKLHRGEASAENRPEGGARFTLSFRD